MLEQYKSILPSKQQLNGVDKDIFLDINLENSFKNIPLTENINTILNLSELLKKEREESTKYFVNGTTDIIVPFIGTIKNPLNISDLFNRFNGNEDINNFYEISDFFNIHICVPSKLVSTTITNQYKLYLKSVYNSTVKSEILFKKSGFSYNLFSDKVYQFICKKVIDISKFDNLISDDEKLILPITDFYIYLEFKNSNRKDSFSIQNTNNNINELYYSDIIYDENEFTFTEINNYIEKVYLNNILSGDTYLNLQYTYTPFSKIKIKDFDNDVEFGSIINETNIPYYASLKSDYSNNYQSNRNEIFTISEYPIFSGSSRLTTSDPLNMLPRKFLFDNKIKNYVYYLDNTIYDINRIQIFYAKYFDLSNKYELKYYDDYYINEIETYKGVSKIVIKNNLNINFNQGDKIYVYYYSGENYVWRDLLPNGFLDTDNNLGVNFPFVNGNHYVSSNFRFFIKPDLTNVDTYNVYNKFTFESDSIGNKLNPNFNKDC